MKKIKLGDLLTIKHGYAFKSEHYLNDGNFALVTLANISESNNFQFDKEKLTYYGASFPQDVILKEGDLILPMTEQVIGLLGNSAFIPAVDGFSFVLNQRVGKVIPSSNVDKYYLHYLLTTKEVKTQLEYRASGTKQRNISPENIYDVTVLVPDLPSQKKIGSVLYSLEQKINLNKKINATLEAMAKTLYMHEFFHKPTNGKLNDIIIENSKSIIPVGAAKLSVGEFPFFTSGDSVLNWTDSLVDGRNIFLNTGGNAGIKFHVGKAAYSTDTWCIAAENLTDYLYLLLKVVEPELDKKFFQGTGLKHLQKPLLKERAIYIPTETEREQFNSIVRPCFTKISANVRESRRLAELRDWLLPMLMNGQIDFKEKI